MLIAFSVAPSGTPADGSDRPDASVHDAVAAAVRVVRESGLPHRTTMFTEMRLLGHGPRASLVAGL